jgi:ribosome maturation factor RimP
MSESGDNREVPRLVGATTNPLVGKVWMLAEPLCRDEGLELVHVEYQREPGGRILRLYVDKDGGITLDDCVAVSRQLSDILDVHLVTEASYRLEVSSPGLHRPLGKLSDFERFKGYKAKVRTSRPIGGQKNFTGVITGIGPESVHISFGENSAEIQLSDIVKAHLIQSNGETAC